MSHMDHLQALAPTFQYLDAVRSAAIRHRVHPRLDNHVPCAFTISPDCEVTVKSAP
ncbi:hypothetical protein GCM10010341_64680 [Streptomyces noursei]|nr:hypothetical protein GCM10010341_64680 [Streptomyces noursei]